MKKIIQSISFITVVSCPFLNITSICGESQSLLERINQELFTAIGTHRPLTVIKNLISLGGDVNAVNDGGIPILIAAVIENNREAVEYLIEQGADVNDADNGGVTALMNAAKYGHYDVAEKLISNGASINIALEHGEPALLFAAKSDSTAIIDLLLNHNAAVDSVNTSGISPLMVVAGKGNIEAVKLLIAKKADVNLFDFKKGLTALMLAAINGHSAVCELLINAGADYTMINYSGMIALELAELHGKWKIAKSIKTWAKKREQARIGYVATEDDSSDSKVWTLLRSSANCYANGPDRKESIDACCEKIKSDRAACVEKCNCLERCKDKRDRAADTCKSQCYDNCESPCRFDYYKIPLQCELIELSKDNTLPDECSGSQCRQARKKCHGHGCSASEECWGTHCQAAVCYGTQCSGLQTCYGDQCSAGDECYGAQCKAAICYGNECQNITQGYCKK